MKIFNKHKKIIGIFLLTFIFIQVTGFFGIVSEVRAQGTGGTGISIDGYYDDWEDKPMTIFTYGSWNGTQLHNVSMIKDDQYIYIYINMHETYGSPIPIDAMYLSINGNTLQFFLRYVNSQDTIDWGRPVNLSQEGIYLDLHPFTYYPNNSLGDAAITVSSGSPNDRMEIRLDISKVEQVMGLNKGTINSGSQLKLTLPNVGAQSIELLGTSTGPLVGVVLSMAVVGGVLLYRSKKTRLVS